MWMFPYFLRDMIRPARMLENRLQMMEELLYPLNAPDLYRLRVPFELDRIEDNTAVIQDKEKFQVKLDVKNFAPEEIKVKTVGNYIQIEAKHEEKEDDRGYISRQFVRRFLLPKGHELKDVVSKLSADGVLTVTAPRKEKLPEVEGERVIPITHVGAEKEDKKDESF